VPNVAWQKTTIKVVGVARVETRQCPLVAMRCQERVNVTLSYYPACLERGTLWIAVVGKV